MYAGKPGIAFQCVKPFAGTHFSVPFYSFTAFPVIRIHSGDIDSFLTAERDNTVFGESRFTAAAASCYKDHHLYKLLILVHFDIFKSAHGFIDGDPHVKEGEQRYGAASFAQTHISVDHRFFAQGFQDQLCRRLF